MQSLGFVGTLAGTFMKKSWWFLRKYLLRSIRVPDSSRLSTVTIKQTLHAVATGSIERVYGPDGSIKKVN